MPCVTATVCIHWESNMPYKGGGIIIDCDCIRGLAQLGIDVVFEMCHET